MRTPTYEKVKDLRYVVVWDIKYKDPKDVPAFAVWDINKGMACFSKSKLICYLFRCPKTVDVYKRSNKYSSYWYPVGTQDSKNWYPANSNQSKYRLRARKISPLFQRFA